MKKVYKEPKIEILEYSLLKTVSTDLLSDTDYGELGGGSAANAFAEF